MKQNATSSAQKNDSDRLQLVPRFWRFDFLEDAEWFDLALADAADLESL